MACACAFDLRRRGIEAIEEGLSTRAATRRFSIEISTAGAWCRRGRATGSVTPDRQGRPVGLKLDADETFILKLVTSEKDIALAEIAERLAAERGVRTCAATVWYFFAKRGLTHKKDGPCLGAAAPGHLRPPATLVRRPDRARSRTADRHRRDRHQHQDGSLAGMGAEG